MTKEQDLQAIGACCYSSLEGMIDSLDCDYDRRDELQERADSNDQDEALDDDELDELRELDELAGDCESEGDADQRICEDPLSISVRSDWEVLGAELEPAEYQILLSTGGPASRIVGELDQYGEPASASLEVQDWFTPWTEYEGSDEEVLLRYAGRFCFGCYR